MPKGSTWFNTSEIDGKSEYCRGCISRRKSRYGKTSFSFETTLSGRSYLSIIRRLKKSGYEVQITETTLYHDLIKRYGKL